MSKTIKVLIADDSAFMRLLITDILSKDEEIDVIGTAIDGKDATLKVKEDKPDVLVLDMNMGEYDGLYAVERIMKECPVPILILSSVGNSNLQPIFDALRLGAVDYLNKPQRGSSKMRLIEYDLLSKIKNASKANLKSNGSVVKKKSSGGYHEFSKNQKYEIIVIGASTGGPSAIEEIIASLPINLTVPVVVCQHMPANFIQTFVNRLNSLSPLNIVLGTLSMELKPGTVIVAPGHSNMILNSGKSGHIRIDFTDEKYSEYNNPSINALMQSVAHCYGQKAIGVILTGMGKDGVNGLKAIKDGGGYTIAQNKESSVIYGMPKVAAERGAVNKTLDIKDIGKFLLNRL